jgi:hypothetical protein
VISWQATFVRLGMVLGAVFDEIVSCRVFSEAPAAILVAGVESVPRKRQKQRQTNSGPKSVAVARFVTDSCPVEKKVDY